MLNYLIQNQDITNLSGYKTKAISKYFFELKEDGDIEKLIQINNFSKENSLKIIILGGGTNTFFAFDFFDGIIIKNSLKGFNLIGDRSQIKVNSGENVINIVNKLEKEYSNISLKPWCSLPGSFGGAIIGNAGCFGLEAQDIFLNAKILDLNENIIKEVNKDFMNFEYRKSVLKGNKEYFLISAKLDISKQIDNFFTSDFRFKNQPTGFNCGSVFKNPVGNFAGKLIEESGLKGKKIGGASISQIHANFIVSDGTATFQNILDLIKLIKKIVFDNYFIELEEEINIINN